MRIILSREKHGIVRNELFEFTNSILLKYIQV